MTFENPWIHGLVMGLILGNVALAITGYSIWFERKFAGRMQNRPGPSVVGPWGLIQPLADVLKLMQKEDIVPRDADKALYNLAPPLTVFCALSALAVVPVAPGIIIADLHIGILSSRSPSGPWPCSPSGWRDGQQQQVRTARYALCGSEHLLRDPTAPQRDGAHHSRRLLPRHRHRDRTAGGNWFAFWPRTGVCAAFALFFLCSLAEANRIPFDIPEAESELVSGVSTEYTGMKFGLFQLAEYLHTFIISLVASALFLGGWDGPGENDGLIWMVIKTLTLFAGIFWIRWSYMRYRSDQLMAICWKFFLPLGLALVMFSALWVHLT